MTVAELIRSLTHFDPNKPVRTILVNRGGNVQYGKLLACDADQCEDDCVWVVVWETDERGNEAA